MPQRHSKNNNDLSYFTYEEKRRLGFGTQKERLGKDSLKPFDACCLCLKAVVEPLSCKKGHLFCKECIYSCLLAQKKDIKRKVATYEAQEKEQNNEDKERILAEKEAELASFDKQNNSAVPSDDLDRRMDRSSSGGFHGANSVKTTAFEEEALRTMKAYWLPSLTPEAAERFEKPCTDTICPEGNEKLRVKDLFEVHFTELRFQEKMAQTGDERFMCPSCSATLTNVMNLTAISTCGHVFCKKCAEKYVAADKGCLSCSKSCRPRDLVDLQRGGTGFAAHGDSVVGTAFKHLGSGSGAANLRPTTRIP